VSQSRKSRNPTRVELEGWRSSAKAPSALALEDTSRRVPAVSLEYLGDGSITSEQSSEATTALPERAHDGRGEELSFEFLIM